MEIIKFSQFYSENEITENFENNKVCLSSSQCLESSNSDHSITTFCSLFSTFSFTVSYFLAHYFGTYVTTLLVPTLEMTNKKHSKLNFRPKVGNRHILQVGYWAWLTIGASTLISYI